MVGFMETSFTARSTGFGIGEMVGLVFKVVGACWRRLGMVAVWGWGLRLGVVVLAVGGLALMLWLGGADSWWATAGGIWLLVVLVVGGLWIGLAEMHAQVRTAETYFSNVEHGSPWDELKLGLRRAWPLGFVGSLLCAALLPGVLLWAVLAGVGGGLGATAGTAGAGVGAAVGILSGAVVFVPAAVWWIVSVFLFAPVMIVEGGGAFRAVGKAWRLVSGFRWHAWGALSLMGALMFCVAMPVLLVGGGPSAVAEEFGADLVVVLSILWDLAVQVVWSSAATALWSCWLAVMYVNLVMRKSVVPTARPEHSSQQPPPGPAPVPYQRGPGL